MTELERRFDGSAPISSGPSRFALVGGVAVSAQAEPRFTRDADLAVAVASDAQAERLVRALRAGGYRAEALVEQDQVAQPIEITRARTALQLIASRGYDRGRNLLTEFEQLLRTQS